MKPASDSLVLKSDYTILLKDDAENNKVESRRKRARLKMDGKGFHSHSYDKDNFVDELNDSLHLTRVRLENCDTRQIVEMGIGSRAVGILVLLELKWIVCELSLTTAADLSLIISVTNKVPTKIG
jgi:hypothetical protein